MMRPVVFSLAMALSFPGCVTSVGSGIPGEDAGEQRDGSDSGVHDQDMCGDRTAGPVESCDGTDFKGESCTSLMGEYYEGVLQCGPHCLSVNTDGCHYVEGCRVEADLHEQLGCPDGACDIDHRTGVFSCRQAGTTAHYSVCSLPSDCLAGDTCIIAGDSVEFRCMPFCTSGGINSCPYEGVCGSPVSGLASTGLCSHDGAEMMCRYCNDYPAGEYDPLAYCSHGICSDFTGQARCHDFCSTGYPPCPQGSTCELRSIAGQPWQVCVPDSGSCFGF